MILACTSSPNGKSLEQRWDSSFGVWERRSFMEKSRIKSIDPRGMTTSFDALVCDKSTIILQSHQVRRTVCNGHICVVPPPTRQGAVWPNLPSSEFTPSSISNNLLSSEEATSPNGKACWPPSSFRVSTVSSSIRSGSGDEAASDPPSRLFSSDHAPSRLIRRSLFRDEVSGFISNVWILTSSAVAAAAVAVAVKPADNTMRWESSVFMLSVSGDAQRSSKDSCLVPRLSNL